MDVAPTETCPGNQYPSVNKANHDPVCRGPMVLENNVSPPSSLPAYPICLKRRDKDIPFPLNSDTSLSWVNGKRDAASVLSFFHSYNKSPLSVYKGPSMLNKGNLTDLFLKSEKKKQPYTNTVGSN